MKVKDDDHLVFESTGAELPANCGFIGINSELELSEGYDGHPCPAVNGKYRWDENCQPIWTKEEREELADYMIGLWKTWKENKE